MRRVRWFITMSLILCIVAVMGIFQLAIGLTVLQEEFSILGCIAIILGILFTASVPTTIIVLWRKRKSEINSD